MVAKQLSVIFLFWLCQIDAISSSALAKVKQASTDLETLLAQPVSANRAEHDATIKKINELLAVIEKSGDAKAAAKYKGLVDSKKQAIDLAEHNVALQEAVVQATTQVATQEKQLAKASKKLESMGLALPKTKTTISSVIDDIDFVMNDFQVNGNESNLDSFEQKIITLIQKALKKAENEDVKHQIEQLKTSTLSVIYQNSLNLIEDGLKAINQLCIAQYQDLESALDPFLTSFDSAVFSDDHGALTMTIQESVEQVKTMHDLFKVYCLQNGFGKKILLQLDQTNKNSFDHIFTEFVASYEKILLLLLDAIETFNANIENLMDDPGLALEVKEQIRSNSDDWFNYLAALDLFEAEFLLFVPDEFKNTMSPDLKPISLIDMWDSLINKKINIPIVAASSQSSIPKPPPLPPKQTVELFVAQKPQTHDLSFEKELADTIKKHQNKPEKNIQIPPPSHPIKSLDSALVAELKNKQKNFVSSNVIDKVDLEQQLRVRLKNLDRIEARIKKLADFGHSAHDEVARFKAKFNYKYDGSGTSSVGDSSLQQYYQDISEINLIQRKIAIKMIDSKKAKPAVSWTVEQRQRFETKKQSLQASLDAKKKLVYDYGYDCALESIKLIGTSFDDINLKIQALITQEKAGNAISIDQCARDLTYCYFIVYSGIYGPVIKLQNDDNPKMKTIDAWYKDAVVKLGSLLHSLQEFCQLFADQSKGLPDTFGQHGIAPFESIIDMIALLQKNKKVENLTKLQTDSFKFFQDLMSADLIQTNDYSGTVETTHNNIFRNEK